MGRSCGGVDGEASNVDGVGVGGAADGAVNIEEGDTGCGRGGREAGGECMRGEGRLGFTGGERGFLAGDLDVKHCTS